jgi:hypothetical protein
MSLKPGQRKVEQLLKQDHGSRRLDEELRHGSFVGIGEASATPTPLRIEATG